MQTIVLLYNLNRHEFEYETEFDSEITIDAIYNALKSNYYVVKLEVDRNFGWIKKLTDINPDLVFNICEGYNGPARESVYGAILEQLHINYSGPDSTNMLLCHNKSLAKELLKNNVKVPRGYCVTKIEEVQEFINLDYPYIVKLNSEGSSMGMSESSIVNNLAELKQEVEKLLKEYNRAVLIEKYVDGQDVSMAFVEGIGALGPCQVLCDAQFYDYEMKSVKDNTVEIQGYDGHVNELKEIVRKIYQKLDLKGYSKIDFRINSSGIYLIEVNAQVSFHPEGEFITCIKKDGYTFDGIINYIVEFALKKGEKINSIGVKR